jgi:nitric oxide reductase NorQ protein
MAQPATPQAQLDQVVKLIGPTGCGKTSVAERFARVFNRPLHIADCGTWDDPIEAFGGPDLVVEDGKPKTEFRFSPFTRAIQQEGAVIVLDEANRPVPSVMNSLLPLLDHRRQVSLNGLDKPVRVAPGVIFFLTINEGSEYTGTYRHDAALNNRVTMQIRMEYLPPKMEAELLTERTGIQTGDAETIAKVANKLRELAKGEDKVIRQPVSTRQMIRVSEVVNAGLKIEAAFEAVIGPQFSMDGGDKSEYATYRQTLQGYL